MRQVRRPTGIIKGCLFVFFCFCFFIFYKIMVYFTAYIFVIKEENFPNVSVFLRYRKKFKGTQK